MPDGILRPQAHDLGPPATRVKKHADIHCTPHMLRHSAAVWMAEARTPMEEIAAYLGHKNPLITARVYARFHPDYLRRGAKALTW